LIVSDVDALTQALCDLVRATEMPRYAATSRARTPEALLAADAEARARRDRALLEAAEHARSVLSAAGVTA
jgi:hypothetical protein